MLKTLLAFAAVAALVLPTPSSAEADPTEAMHLRVPCAVAEDGTHVCLVPQEALLALVAVNQNLAKALEAERASKVRKCATVIPEPRPI